ncbi:MAG: CRISPR-associated endonuclease Cas2 [Candidatus Nitrosocaldaceae archaeon]
MRYIIIYDISDDDLRSIIAKKLEDYGLRRVQFSSFVGELQRYKLNSLIYELKSIINGRKSERKSIIVYPLCDSCYSRGVDIGNNTKKKESDTIVF